MAVIQSSSHLKKNSVRYYHILTKSSCTVPVIFYINHNLTISWQIFAESPITTFHENLYTEGKMLHVHRHDKANTNFLQLYKCTLQTKPNVTILQYDIHM